MADFDEKIDENENPIFDAEGSYVEADKTGDATGNAAGLTRDQTEFDDGKEPLPPWRQAAKTIDDNTVKQLLSAVCTILALFLADVRDWALPESADMVVDFLHAFVFLFFIMEISVQLAAHRGYYTNLFFWLDVMATLSLLPELPLHLFLSPDWAQEMGAIFRSGRAARAGARAGRLQGLVRLARVFKIILAFLPTPEVEPPVVLRQSEHDHEQHKDVVPEALGSQVTQSVARIMIIAVIMAMFISTFFAYHAPCLSEELGLRLVAQGVDSTKDATQQCAANATNGAIDRQIDCGVNGTVGFLQDFLDLYYVQLGPEQAPLLDDRASYSESRWKATNKVEFGDTVGWFDDGSSVTAVGRNSFFMTVSVVSLLVLAGFVLSTEMNNLIAMPMQRLVKSQALGDALLEIFRESKDPLPTLRASARSILHAEVVNIYFVDEASDTLWCSSEGDEITPYKQEIRMRMGEGLVGKCAAAHIPMSWTFGSEADLMRDIDAKEDPSLAALISSHSIRGGKKGDGRKTWWASSVLCFPLVQTVGKKNFVVGVIQAINKRMDQAHSTSVISTITHLAGCKPKELVGFDEVDTELMDMLGEQLSQIIKSFQMDAMYSNMFANTDDETAIVMQGMLASYATPEFVENIAHEHHIKGPNQRDGM